MNCPVRSSVRAGMLSVMIAIAACDRHVDEADHARSEPVASTAGDASQARPADGSDAPAPAEAEDAAQTDSQYRFPPGVAASLQAPIGHVVTLAGFDFQTQPGLLAWQDPADNLIDGRALHRLSATPTWGLIESTAAGLMIQVGPQTMRIFAVIEVRPTPPTSSDGSSLTRFVDVAVPDVSQHTRPRWEFGCGPAAAANLLIALARRDPALARRLDLASPYDPPSIDRLLYGDTDPSADPSPASLTGLMHTRRHSGTSGQDLYRSLQSMTESDQASSVWQTTAVEKPDAQAIRSLAEALAQGGGGLLLLLPVGSGNTPPSPGSPADSDPRRFATDPPQTTDARRSASPEADEISDRLPLPAIDLSPPAELRGDPVLPLVGEWVQTAGPNLPDFAAGGYADSRLTVTAAGTLEVARRFDHPTGPFTLTRRLRVVNSPDGPVTLTAFEDDQTLEGPSSWIDDYPAVQPPQGLPWQRPMQVSATQLRWDGKTYERSPTK